MQPLASKLLGHLHHQRSPTESLQHQTSTYTGIVEGDQHTDLQQGGTQGVGETKPKKLSARERLDRLSKLRIQPSALSIASSGPCKRGGQGEVVQATFRRRVWNHKKQVAVKKLAYPGRIEMHKFSNEFAHEVELLAGLSHENIVSLVGFVEDLENGQAWIVLSWAPNGNVSEFLATGRWETPERISLIQDTLEGIKYLHTRQPPICHGDLKSLNILVDSSYRAIITDFGSARAITERPKTGTGEESHNGENASNPTPERGSHQIHAVATGNQLTLTGPAWSLRWAPPEVVKGDHPGLPSDIWSAGWVCWELMTDKLPFPDLDSGTAITLRVVRGRVPSASEEEQLSQIVRLCNLMTDCWRMDPQDRPSISRCCDEVKWVPSLPPLGGVPKDSKAGTSRLLLQMGRTHHMRARYDDAASLFQQVLQVATGEEVQSERAEALYWLGDVSFSRSKYTEAEDSYAQARDMYANTGDDLGLANALQGLGGVYHRQSKIAKAEASLVWAQDIYNDIGDDQGQASTLCGLGHIYRMQLDYNQAAKSFNRAREIYTCIGNGQGQANALQGLGGIYRVQSKFAEAEDSLTQAQSIYARIGDDVGRASTLLGIGDVYCARSEYTKAASSYNTVKVIYAGLGNEEGQANALYGLGEVYRRLSNHIEATSYYTQAEEIYARIGNQEGQANALYWLGQVSYSLHQHAEAASFYTGAEKIYARIGNDQGHGDALCRMGDIYRSQLKVNQAVASYARAEKLYGRMNNDKDQANALNRLGQVYRSLNRYAEAASSYDRARRLYARVGNQRGQAESLCGLGEVDRCQSKFAMAASSYAEAEKIFHRIGDDKGRADALCGLGEIHHRQSRYTKAASSYTQAQEIYSHLGNYRGLTNVSQRLKDVGENMRGSFKHSRA